MDLFDLKIWMLFSSALLSSTLLPGGSEVALVYLLNLAEHSPLWLILVATAGNTLGGMSSWFIGFIIAKYFPVRRFSEAKQQKALSQIQRWGSPVLLLSWLPIIGDPLCLMAGWLKIRWLPAFIYIAIGKTLRYAVVVWLFYRF